MILKFGLQYLLPRLETILEESSPVVLPSGARGWGGSARSVNVQSFFLFACTLVALRRRPNLCAKCVFAIHRSSACCSACHARRNAAPRDSAKGGRLHPPACSTDTGRR